MMTFSSPARARALLEPLKAAGIDVLDAAIDRVT